VATKPCSCDMRKAETSHAEIVLTHSWTAEDLREFDPAELLMKPCSFCCGRRLSPNMRSNLYGLREFPPGMPAKPCSFCCRQRSHTVCGSYKLTDLLVRGIGKACERAHPECQRSLAAFAVGGRQIPHMRRLYVSRDSFTHDWNPEVL